ncbi:DNA mismatch repair protein MutS [Paenibacillus solanacearum]|uniref:DNA mismatch repair protein MutS n=1 Tax=Paenibacillus solanacearum TaxID=2048548 RepID=A0A916NLD3_9BACL|nr:DNA mismatch repair protein MutS [Paenibacillus solanacearum]CAG7649494.1 DNA mismatch repair protein MutS [Paenibacillus solanacearum]
MAKYTPMIEQYLAIKAEVQDAFLFFRLGDFYEMFFDDAIVASRELEITLTGREGGMEERIPMCGVPHHSAENYVARLVEKGYKVAICEQVEDPSEAKGVVRREVVRIVTPGTVMDQRSLSEANNYIAAVALSGEAYGIAVCDISTGELYVTRLDGSFELLLDELNVYGPSEILGSPALLEQIRSGSAAWLRSAVMTPRDGRSAAGGLPAEGHFLDSQLAGLPEGGRETLSLLMGYLKETQKRSLSHIKQIRVYEPTQYMVMDPFTRRNLELVETVRDRSKKGSLLWLLDKTVTAMGGRLLRRWIEKPLMNASHIAERLEAVDRLYHQLIVREELRTSLKEVYDLERLTARIAYGSAGARDLVALMRSLQQVPMLQQLCESSGSATLAKLAARIDPCQDLMASIADAIVDEPPVSIRDGGMIRAGYNARLDQLREASANGKQWLAELEKQERERTGIKSLKIGYNKVFGYFIEVTKSNLGTLEEGRYERKQTLANAERFVTPELKEKEALILEAEEGMVDLEHELFIELRDRLGAHVSRLQTLAELIATADVYQSLAHVSAANRFTKPEVGEFYELQVEEGRHPVVEAVLEDSVFIANETELSREAGSMLLITGPNMAGKSTYMRQVAIICLMAQIGCFVPAKRAKVPLIDRIFTRIGAADDLIGGQSTFMVEMMDIQIMTAKATSRSLVIIDELGRGTSTGEGMAIAQAVIEYLHDKIGCKTLVSTHFHELAHLEDSLRDLRNYCMAVKESGQQVTFLRRLIPGAASTSYGIYCAQIAGLPTGIIDRSYELLHVFEARAEWQQGREETAAASAQVGAPAAPGSSQTQPAQEERHTADTMFVPAPEQASEPSVTREPDSPEASAPSAGQAVPDRQQAVEQLSLFALDVDAKAEKSAKKDPLADKIVGMLRSADLMNMTPMTAMNFLYELKKQLPQQ